MAWLQKTRWSLIQYENACLSSMWMSPRQFISFVPDERAEVSSNMSFERCDAADSGGGIYITTLGRPCTLLLFRGVLDL